MTPIPTGPVSIVIDDDIQVVPPDVLDRSMMSIARHPGGAIYLNTQAGPLYRSDDDGRIRSPVAIRPPDQPSPQTYHGMGIARSGRIFVAHSPADQKMLKLFVSYTDDGGDTWSTSTTDFGRFPPGVPDMKFHEDGNRTFVELDDGTLIFSTTIVPNGDYGDRYPPRGDLLYGGQPGDLFSDVIFRSTDGGETWGDPTQVFPFLNPHESNLAVDPSDPDRLLIMTRCQRGVPARMDAEALMARTGNPPVSRSSRACFSNPPTAAVPSPNWVGPTTTVTVATSASPPATSSSLPTAPATSTALSSPALAWTAAAVGRMRPARSGPICSTPRNSPWRPILPAIHSPPRR